MPNNLQQMRLKLLQKESFKKQRKQLLIKLQEFQKRDDRIIQKKMKKYLRKNIYPENLDKKLLMM